MWKPPLTEAAFMSWLKARMTDELRTTARSPAATLACTVSGAVSARRASPAATNSSTMGKIHQRRRSVARNPLGRVMVCRIRLSSAGLLRPAAQAKSRTHRSQLQRLSGLLSVLAIGFLAGEIPPGPGLRHHQPGQQQLLDVEKHVQYPHRVARDVAVERTEQLTAQRADEARDLVHQRRRHGASPVLDDVL